MASSNSPCAACKHLRRKCTQECVFAPYFPPDEPNKFANVHKVFGASNVTKLLNELSGPQREDAVNSLAYEAEARLRDPVYGCVGLISLLQRTLRDIQRDLITAKKELSSYLGPSTMLPMAQPHYPMLHHPHLGNSSSSMAVPFGNMQMGLGLQPPSQTMTFREQQQQQQMLEAQQLAMAAMAVREQHEMMRNYEQQQQQAHQEVVRYNRLDGGGNSSGHGFSQMGAHSQLALAPFDNPFQVQDQEHMHQQSHHHQQSESDDSKSAIGPSS
ncbi:hypothetical protein MRB53_020575 [Persea americana]|uniref:Uncharacterized protein n=1 Tax=Persea americana TaxID=3435 RepID=A0ACC2L2P9_PERAE|nr:hypothetical protein MRB53_020575 [Persea americana]